MDLKQGKGGINMKKKIIIILIILVGGITFMNTKDKNNNITFMNELVESVEFDTNFNEDDYTYSERISKKHSDAIGDLEWVGEV